MNEKKLIEVLKILHAQEIERVPDRPKTAQCPSLARFATALRNGSWTAQETAHIDTCVHCKRLKKTLLPKVKRIGLALGMFVGVVIVFVRYLIVRPKPTRVPAIAGSLLALVAPLNRQMQMQTSPVASLPAVVSETGRLPEELNNANSGSAGPGKHRRDRRIGATGLGRDGRACGPAIGSEPTTSAARVQVIQSVQEQFQAADDERSGYVGEQESAKLEATIDRIAMSQADRVVVSVPDEGSIAVNLSQAQWRRFVDVIEDNVASHEHRPISKETMALITMLKLVPGTISVSNGGIRCQPEEENTNSAYNRVFPEIIAQVPSEIKPAKSLRTL
jgi:hypothetical protein